MYELNSPKNKKKFLMQTNVNKLDASKLLKPFEREIDVIHGTFHLQLVVDSNRICDYFSKI